MYMCGPGLKQWFSALRQIKFFFGLGLTAKILIQKVWSGTLASVSLSRSACRSDALLLTMVSLLFLFRPSVLSTRFSHKCSTFLMSEISLHRVKQKIILE